MKRNKTIGVILIIIMLLSTFSSLDTLNVYADDRGADFTTDEEGNEEGNDKVEKTERINGTQEGFGDSSGAYNTYVDQVYDDVGSVHSQLNKDDKAEKLNQALDDFWKQIRTIISFVTGAGSLTSFIIFIIIFGKLATMPNHPMQRRKVMEDIVTSGIATILLGGVSLILSVFYEFFQGLADKGVMFADDWRVAFTIALVEYKTLIAFALGLATLAMIGFFIKSFLQLTAAGDNPQARKQATTGVLFTFISAAGLGGITIVVALFNGVLM